MRFPFKHITAAVVLAGTFLAPAMAPAQTDAQKAAIASLVSAYYKAAATGDGATFASLTTRKSYTFTTIKGNVLTGTEVLEKAGAARGKALAGGASNPSGSVKVTAASLAGNVITAAVAVQGSMNVQAGGEGGSIDVIRHATHTLTIVQGKDGKWRISSDKVNTQRTT